MSRPPPCRGTVQDASADADSRRRVTSARGSQARRRAYSTAGLHARARWPSERRRRAQAALVAARCASQSSRSRIAPSATSSRRARSAAQLLAVHRRFAALPSPTARGVRPFRGRLRRAPASALQRPSRRVPGDRSARSRVVRHSAVLDEDSRRRPEIRARTRSGRGRSGLSRSTRRSRPRSPSSRVHLGESMTQGSHPTAFPRLRPRLSSADHHVVDTGPSRLIVAEVDACFVLLLIARRNAFCRFA